MVMAEGWTTVALHRDLGCSPAGIGHPRPRGYTSAPHSRWGRPRRSREPDEVPQQEDHCPDRRAFTPGVLLRSQPRRDMHSRDEGQRRGTGEPRHRPRGEHPRILCQRVAIRGRRTSLEAGGLHAGDGRRRVGGGEEEPASRLRMPCPRSYSGSAPLIRPVWVVDVLRQSARCRGSSPHRFRRDSRPSRYPRLPKAR